MSLLPGIPIDTLQIPRGNNGNDLIRKLDVSVTRRPVISGDQETERIRKLFQKAELSASAYDTAWVAMVRSSTTREAPSFPSCLDWILQNQEKDGSWGLLQQPWLTKDKLSSTLACVLALKRWGVGERHVHKALGFMERHSVSLADPSHPTPVGFDVVFPAMVRKCALEFDLNIPLHTGNLDALLRKRESTLNSPSRNRGHEAYVAYVSEGILGCRGNSLDDYERITAAETTTMDFKRKNGSLFNSPSATAAAFMHHRDADFLRYLRSVVDFAGAGVPAIYPNEVQAKLCLIDDVESLGVRRLFRQEIKTALDEIYQWWQQGEEEIFLDITACAMAFRLLRLNGYTVSPDVFTQFNEDRFWTDTLEGYLKDEVAVLELLKASQITFPNEPVLEDQKAWTSQFLLNRHPPSQNRANNELARFTDVQVRELANHPFHADLERLSARRNIKQQQQRRQQQQQQVDSFRCSGHGRDDDLLKLAAEDFNFCQSFHHEEFEQIMRWMKDYKLDEKKMAKVKIGYGYFSAAANFFEPELAHARFSWTKHGILTALIDDLYDDCGTIEEHRNLLDLLERWDASGPKAEFCSKEVETLYWALHSVICETVENAMAWQGRSVMDHVVQLWVDLLRSMMQEAEWARINAVPALDDYMSTASTSFALGPIIVPTIYLVGPPVPDEVARGPDLHALFQAVSISGRLLNDLAGFETEREAAVGKPNAVALVMRRGNGVREEAIEEIRGVIEEKKRELLRLVLDERRQSRVPKECRDLFWAMNKAVHLVYKKKDSYNSMDLVQVAGSVIKEPI